MKRNIEEIDGLDLNVDIKNNRYSIEELKNVKNIYSSLLGVYDSLKDKDILSNLRNVYGDIDFYDMDLNLSNLRKCVGNFFIYKGSYQLDNLELVDGCLSISSYNGDFKNLKTITGDLYLNCSNVNLPNLQTIKGSLKMLSLDKNFNLYSLRKLSGRNFKWKERL